MQLSIRHETVYQYTTPVSYTIQQLRLSPRNDANQRILSWHVDTTGRRSEFVDAFGNPSQTLTIVGTHQEVRIVASGVVDVMPLVRGRLSDDGSISPLVFTTPTSLTEADEEVAAFAAKYLRDRADSSRLMALAEAIRDAVAYQSGATAVTTRAADALRLGQGVCQDHAHLFLACCRAQGIPSRYVSGYIDPGDTSHAESHAWADAWVEDEDFNGWVSIDITHARFPTDGHCRLAIGRDYDSAAPVRGVRKGGGTESLRVRVDVSPHRL